VLDSHQLPGAVTQSGRYPRASTPVNLAAIADRKTCRYRIFAKAASFF
jgi:hypothetical protein